MSDESQKVAIITGGSQGIGASLVTAYRRRGWSVVATARTNEAGRRPGRAHRRRRPTAEIASWKSAGHPVLGLRRPGFEFFRAGAVDLRHGFPDVEAVR
jgi:NAD(P)-dependent dehydrogenase (short-subunit alcohol dehydrogenase family)